MAEAGVIAEQVKTSVVEKGRALGEKAKSVGTAVRAAPQKMPEFVAQADIKHPILTLRKFASLKTETTRRSEAEEKAGKITGIAHQDKVLDYRRYNPSISPEEASARIRRGDVTEFLKDASDVEFNMYKDMLSTGEPILTQELVDPTDPSKGFKPSPLEELRSEMLKQLPGEEKRRRRNLIAAIAGALAVGVFDTGKQSAEGQA
jgi:hypothetical protein